MKEVWKDVPEFEGIYQVSNLGNVKSISRKIFVNGGSYVRKGKILNQFLDRGYPKVHLYKNGKGKVWKVHQLVAMSFLNHKPNGMSLVVDHKNNIKNDNRLENLQIITQRENISKDQKNKSSKYTGVCWVKQQNKWLSQIRTNGKDKHLGYFTDEYEAHLAYQTELKNLRK